MNSSASFCVANCTTTNAEPSPCAIDCVFSGGDRQSFMTMSWATWSTADPPRVKLKREVNLKFTEQQFLGLALPTDWLLEMSIRHSLRLRTRREARVSAGVPGAGTYAMDLNQVCVRACATQ